MKRTLSVLCILALLVTLIVVPRTEAMAATSADQYVSIAKQYIGKTGSGFNSMKVGWQNIEWCAWFCNFVFKKTSGLKAGTNYPETPILNVPLLAKWYASKGRFALTRRNSSGTIEAWTKSSYWNPGNTYNSSNFIPEKGDLVIFETDGKPVNGPDHVGIVTGRSGDTIYTIEGNVGNRDNYKSSVQTRSYNYKERGSTVWGFMRPSGSMTPTKTVVATSPFTAGPRILSVTPNHVSVNAVIKWQAVKGADFYDVEVYEEAQYKLLKQGKTAKYVEKLYKVKGTSAVVSKNLKRDCTYYVQVAACTTNYKYWLYGASASFRINSPVVKPKTTTIAALLSSKTCKGYMRVTTNQRAYTGSNLSGFDGSYVYTSDFTRIIRKVGNSLLVEYPTSGGKTKQRYVSASMFFCDPNYNVWSKTAVRNIRVTSRPGAGVNVGTVYNKDTVYVLGKSGNYYQILYPAGSIWKFGFVPVSQL